MQMDGKIVLCSCYAEVNCSWSCFYFCVFIPARNSPYRYLYKCGFCKLIHAFLKKKNEVSLHNVTTTLNQNSSYIFSVIKYFL